MTHLSQPPNQHGDHLSCYIYGWVSLFTDKTRGAKISLEGMSFPSLGDFAAFPSLGTNGGQIQIAGYKYSSAGLPSQGDVWWNIHTSNFF